MTMYICRPRSRIFKHTPGPIYWKPTPPEILLGFCVKNKITAPGPSQWKKESASCVLNNKVISCICYNTAWAAIHRLNTCAHCISSCWIYEHICCVQTTEIWHLICLAKKIVCFDKTSCCVQTHIKWYNGIFEAFFMASKWLMRLAGITHAGTTMMCLVDHL